MKSIKNFVALAIAGLLMLASGFAMEVEETIPLQLRPDQIVINDQIISYTDFPGEAISQYAVMVKRFRGADLNPDVTKELVISYSPASKLWPEDKIRLIVINSDQVRTYQDINVGTPASVVEETFLYENVMKRGTTTVLYCVLFQGETEVDAKAAPQGKAWLWLEYACENDIVTQIRMYDVFFGSRMQ